jgi:hypothetical protein
VDDADRPVVLGSCVGAITVVVGARIFNVESLRIGGLGD